MTILKEPALIGRKLHELVLQNSHDFSPHFQTKEKEFLDWFHQYDGLKTEIRVKAESKDHYELVKMSVLLSDFTSVYPYHPKHFLYTFHPEKMGHNVTGDPGYLRLLKKQLPKSKLFGGYGSISEELLEDTFNELSPLIEAGKIIIRPEKIIVIMDDKNRVLIHPADANGAPDEWRAMVDNHDQSSYPIFDRKSSIDQHRQVADILLPFLSGTSISDFAKIIEDEGDILSSFRVQTKAYMKLLGSGDVTAAEFRRDTIQPKLDQISRKFNQIANMHKLKVAGATVGAVGLGLISLAQTGLAASMSQFISFGLGTVGFIKNETEYQSAIAQLKDIPEYLLWRLSKSKK